MSGESSEIMHLTQLERESAGAYACGATNTEGETRSSSITLKVQCKYIESNYKCHALDLLAFFVYYLAIYSAANMYFSNKFSIEVTHMNF